MNILILRYKAIGDTLLDTPVIRALYKYIPNAKIYYVTEKSAIDVIKYHPNVYKAMYVEAGFWSEVRFLRFLWQNKMDIVFDYICYPRSAIITILTFAPFRIGRPIRYRRFAYNMLYQFPSPEEYQGIQRLIPLQKFFKIKIDRDDIDAILPDIYWREEDEESIERYIKENGIYEDRMVVINPNAYKESCRWIPEYNVKLAQMFINKGYDVIFTAGPGEEDFTNMLVRKVKGERIFFIRDKILSIVYLLSKALVFITGDTGLKHIAVAVRTPTITIYGPYDPWVWNPPDTERFPYFIADSGCVLCRTAYCKTGTRECMYNIKPEIVFYKALELIEKYGKDRDFRR